MGDTGRWGPGREFFYEWVPAASEEGHADCQFPCECGRYVEIWNLVFMQFNRDANGRLDPLPKPCVDTGMGLERVAALLQGKISNYDTDLFEPLTKRAAELCGVDFNREESLEGSKGGAASLRVIADHARATTFLIADGVVPSNEGRGYVLRKIMRRAIRHGKQLGSEAPFFYKMVESVSKLMSEAYPEIGGDSGSRVQFTVQDEEIRFNHTLLVGQNKLEAIFLSLGAGTLLTDEQLRSRTAGVLPGAQAFTLYDTYGLPRDFMEDAARDLGFQFDSVGFERAMEEQRTKARASWKGTHKEAANPAFAKIAETFKTEPSFYSGTTAKDCRVEAIITKTGPVNELKAGESAEVVLDRTAIYAESGGQIADTGAFYDASESQVLAEVSGAYYPVAGLGAHRITAKDNVRVGDRVTVVADADPRGRVI